MGQKAVLKHVQDGFLESYMAKEHDLYRYSNIGVFERGSLDSNTTSDFHSRSSPNNSIVEFNPLIGLRPLQTPLYKSTTRDIPLSLIHTLNHSGHQEQSADAMDDSCETKEILRPTEVEYNLPTE